MITYPQIRISEQGQPDPVDEIKDLVLNILKTIRFDKHMKKAEYHNGQNGMI